MEADLQSRLNLLKNYPCFSQFTSDQLQEFAKLLTDVHFAIDDHIVTEGDAIDSIYFIVRGEAEVVHFVKHRMKTMKEIIAKLSANDSIGLSDTGFFSASGYRVASVIASTPLHALKINIETFSQYLAKHHLQKKMLATAEQMLRMQFIKESLPFTHLAPARTHWLASHVEQVEYKAGDYIFKQGEVGDKCYLVKSGKVEIIFTRNQDEKTIAILRPPALFGEATLITRSERNASARALTDCDLLVINQKYLTELLESDANVANTFMGLMIDRARPNHHPSVTKHSRVTSDGQNLTILKHTQLGTYFQLSKEGEFIWHKLDGEHSLQEVTLELAQQYNVFAPDNCASHHYTCQ